MRYLVTATIVLISAFWLSYEYIQGWREGKRELPAPIDYQYKRGTTASILSKDLESLGVVSPANVMFFQLRFLTDYRSLQAGPYRFEGKISPMDVIKKLRDGDIYRPILVSYVIPEGFNVRNIGPRFVAQGITNTEEFAKLWTDADLLAELEVPSSSFEGFIYPATYQFTEKVSLKSALAAGVRVFNQHLPVGYREAAEAMGLSLKDAVTFASLIEVETSQDDERALVSEVIWNRLRKKEPLGIDAALIYGIKNYDGDIKWKDLKDTKNLYNSRIYKGLPPTPIASVSVRSLQAVLNPSNQGYYYYVRDAETSDRHIFSKTLKEHNRHVAKLVGLTRSASVRKGNKASSK